jgi:tetratricopeptide (TPR) repeat protein
VIRRLVLAAAVAVLLHGPAAADQTDPRLDGLFDDLLQADGPVEAHPVIGRIWDVWTHHDDADAVRDMRLGIGAMNAGQFRAAIQVFSETVKRFPDFAEAWNKRATAYFIIGEYASSIADCRRVLALEPRHFGALAGLGMIYRALDEPETALGWYKRALDVNPHLTDAQDAVRALEAEIKGRAI